VNGTSQVKSDAIVDTATKFTQDVIAEDKRLNDLVAKAKASSPLERALANKKGEEFLAAGELWEAYVAFAKALNREALLLVAKQMTTTGNGLHAIRPLLVAALIPIKK
jgi:hypothetical protein